ncbi:MAG: phosphoglycerol geranylgeranyltransferase [Candidatus Thermoplasmatota archaeon]|jgi:phosphoglycerol geranylgeranyltransferase|nr:phosphoglycerol geranylgeranyltransferase [Euryarchaeota archaeon]MBK70240.1 phosphoglycerol geranylgeranyltransferase [Euryarchaeota archaeon]MEC7743961.1 phosphoglycerol geranylgeranyltransferase [Candidatus Thermoplasmatota archaeon]|tara:strand:+ start:2449 stop:3261 length:813 start_codon:yes stop_codon:yes gene_type:complete
MAGRGSETADYACSRAGPTRHAILIDPADQTPDMAAKRCLAAVAAGSRMVLVGGSSDTDMENVHETVVAIQEALELVEWASTQDAMSENAGKVPVVLFPQGAAALSPAADAITFMMLMNSTTPRFLIEEQVTGAPFIRKAGVEPIPMGYLICAPGGKAGEVGMADLIQPDEAERVSAYSMTAESYGFRMFYLEAGSGAEYPVNPDLIRAARESCDLALVVGGGIRDGATARAAAKAGADWIITGNLAEDYDDVNELQEVLRAFITEMNSD